MLITKEIAQKELREAVGKPDIDFREGQWEAIDGVLHNRRQLVVQRTGWGKSMIYFLAAKFLRQQGKGMTLIISPLLALMRNQVAAAEKVVGKGRCITINSSNYNPKDKRQWNEIKEKVLSGLVDILIISPERLENEEFKTDVLEPIANTIGLLVIDEAHCISDWGHDFRPDYKKLSRLLVQLTPAVPVLATTATATNRVIADIKAQLGGAVELSRGNLVRDSLYLQNIKLRSQEARLAWLADALSSKISGSGIIYTLTTRDAGMVARWLRENGIQAYEYYGNVSPSDDLAPEFRKFLELEQERNPSKKNSTNVYREFLEKLLIENRIRVLVATSALGMGFDKPDLKFVIHYQRPKSIVDYYQQVGRAGRGISSAYGILLNGEEDDKIADFFIRKAFPSEHIVKQILDEIASSEGLKTSELAKRINIRQGKIEQVLKFVMSENPQPVVKNALKYQATLSINKYKLPEENIRRLTEMRKAECRQMDGYVNTKSCLTRFICEALESPSGNQTCGKCRNCSPEHALSPDVNPARELEATNFLQKLYTPIIPRKKWSDPEKANERFNCTGQDIPQEFGMDAGKALSRYGAGEWGRLTQEGKYGTKHFDDKLVDACVVMWNEWKPEKRPSWVVPIPSRRDNALVRDFAERLAKKLGLPCWQGLTKILNKPAQKNMENSVHQQNNVIDAFDVEGTLPKGGCLLVDDMVDSRWTLTIAAAVLRHAGADFVIPLALADTSNDGE